MNILALDTCTELCSAALLYKGEIIERVENTQRGHSDLILGMMDELFKLADVSISAIDSIAFGRGPGSFTGVRVSVGVAQGIAFARDIPVIPISSLAAVAQGTSDAFDANHIAVAMDARMGEVYCANYQREDGLLKIAGQERVCPPEQFTADNNQQWVGAGTGWAKYESLLCEQFSNNLINISADQFPRAKDIIKLAQFEAESGQMLAAEKAFPVYLRNNVAKKKSQQKNA